MKILSNQISYQTNLPKKAVVQLGQKVNDLHFQLVDEQNIPVYDGVMVEVGHVDQWHTGFYYTIDFSDFAKTGKYYLVLANEPDRSHPIFIDEGQKDLRLVSALTYWFKGQRATGEWGASDKHAEFMGDREGTLDIHGGWFDATGDVGVHTSHQSHTAFYNPQQMAFSAYAFYQLAEQLKHASPNYTAVKRRILDEATYGADSVMRRFVPERAFIKSVDRPNAYYVVEDSRKMGFELHHSSDQFGEASTRDQEVVTDLNYETSFRSGGGTAIAALAIAGRHYYPSAQFTSGQYIETAKKAYHYLEEHNSELTNDGKDNLIDYYCALLACVELYKTTEEYGYLLHARDWAQKINQSLTNIDGYDWLNIAPEMPYFHPSDEGLPVFALLLYSEVENDKSAAEKAVNTATILFKSLLKLNHDTNNPFDYPRMIAKNKATDKANEQFFFPHHTAADPWWQGENARLASLATAAFKLAQISNNNEFKHELITFGQAQLNWIEGCNPYDASMIEGFGYNHIQYHFGDRLDFLNAPGGIVNGITSGIDNEHDIGFIKGPEDGVNDNWRWAEQWIPHVSWALLALGEKDKLNQ